MWARMLRASRVFDAAAHRRAELDANPQAHADAI
jgi:hypothetical protein